jgi:predicted dehydrogenase
VENYADEALVCGPEHWLWNPARSGGLALAADIHWLDLATRLLGPAQAIQTWQPAAKDGVVPRRLITTTHRSDAVASVYHAFDTRSDATGCTVLIAFEEGEARVEGWIPRQLTIACPADRLLPLATLLGVTSCPTASTGDGNQVTVVLNARSDRRSAYLELIRTTLRQVLAQARGQATDAMNLTAARTATATALAAEVAAVWRRWITVGADGPLAATG